MDPSVDEIERTVFDYGHTNDQPLGMNEDDERENDAVEGETNSLRKAWLKNSGGSRHSQERGITPERSEDRPCEPHRTRPPSRVITPERSQDRPFESHRSRPPSRVITPERSQGRPFEPRLTRPSSLEEYPDIFLEREKTERCRNPSPDRSVERPNANAQVSLRPNANARNSVPEDTSGGEQDSRGYSTSFGVSPVQELDPRLRRNRDDRLHPSSASDRRAQRPSNYESNFEGAENVGRCSEGSYQSNNNPRTRSDQRFSTFQESDNRQGYCDEDYHQRCAKRPCYRREILSSSEPEIGLGNSRRSPEESGYNQFETISSTTSSSFHVPLPSAPLPSSLVLDESYDIDNAGGLSTPLSCDAPQSRRPIQANFQVPLPSAPLPSSLTLLEDESCDIDNAGALSMPSSAPQSQKSIQEMARTNFQVPLPSAPLPASLTLLEDESCDIESLPTPGDDSLIHISFKDPNEPRAESQTERKLRQGRNIAFSASVIRCGWRLANMNKAKMKALELNTKTGENQEQPFQNIETSATDTNDPGNCIEEVQEQPLHNMHNSRNCAGENQEQPLQNAAIPMTDISNPGNYIVSPIPDRLKKCLKTANNVGVRNTTLPTIPDRQLKKSNNDKSAAELPNNPGNSIMEIQEQQPVEISTTSTSNPGNYIVSVIPDRLKKILKNANNVGVRNATLPTISSRQLKNTNATISKPSKQSLKNQNNPTKQMPRNEPIKLKNGAASSTSAQIKESAKITTKNNAGKQVQVTAPYDLRKGTARKQVPANAPTLEATGISSSATPTRIKKTAKITANPVIQASAKGPNDLGKRIAYTIPSRIKNSSMNTKSQKQQSKYQKKDGKLPHSSSSQFPESLTKSVNNKSRSSKKQSKKSKSHDSEQTTAEQPANIEMNQSSGSSTAIEANDRNTAHAPPISPPGPSSDDVVFLEARRPPANLLEAHLTGVQFQDLKSQLHEALVMWKEQRGQPFEQATIQQPVTRHHVTRQRQPVTHTQQPVTQPIIESTCNEQNTRDNQLLIESPGSILDNALVVLPETNEAPDPDEPSYTLQIRSAVSSPSHSPIAESGDLSLTEVTTEIPTQINSCSTTDNQLNNNPTDANNARSDADEPSYTLQIRSAVSSPSHSPIVESNNSSRLEVSNEMLTQINSYSTTDNHLSNNAIDVNDARSDPDGPSYTLPILSAVSSPSHSPIIVESSDSSRPEVSNEETQMEINSCFTMDDQLINNANLCNTHGLDNNSSSTFVLPSLPPPPLSGLDRNEGNATPKSSVSPASNLVVDESVHKPSNKESNPSQIGESSREQDSSIENQTEERSEDCRPPAEHSSEKEHDSEMHQTTAIASSTINSGTTPLVDLDDDERDLPILRIRTDLFYTPADERREDILKELEACTETVSVSVATAVSNLDSALLTGSVPDKLTKLKDLRLTMINGLLSLDSINVQFEAEDLETHNVTDSYNFANVLQIPIEEMAEYFLKILAVSFFIREPACAKYTPQLRILYYRLSRVLNYYVAGGDATQTEGNLQNILLVISARTGRFRITLEEITRTWDYVRTFHIITEVNTNCVLFEQSVVGFEGFSEQLDAIVCKVRDITFRNNNMLPPPRESEAQNYSFENDMKILFEIRGRELTAPPHCVLPVPAISSF